MTDQARIAKVMAQLEAKAQKDAEDRLDLAYEVLWHDEMSEGEEPHEGFQDLAGHYCGCTTCTVREVLDAALPSLLRIFELAWQLPPEQRAEVFGANLEDSP